MFACNIPFEIQEEIIKRVLHVKSLIRFRSVSKQWKSLIDSSQFITHHVVNQTQPGNLLLLKYCYRLLYAEEICKYVSIVNDDSFPHPNSYLHIPPIIARLRSPSLLECSHGLVCLDCCYEDTSNDNKNLIVVWNPSIRKSVGITMPTYSFAVGFGICPKTNDPKIVSIIDGVTTVDWEAEIFALSTGIWRRVSMNLHMPFHLVEFDRNQVVIDGVIYWLAGGESMYKVLIISFDLTTEEFEQVEVSETLARSIFKHITKLKESLALIGYNENLRGCDVWMMIKNGDSKSSFTKLFEIDFVAFDNLSYYNVIGFTMNGHVIIEEEATGRLKVYEPGSKRISYLEIDLEIDGVGYSWEFHMACYTESLFLLNHSRCGIF